MVKLNGGRTGQTRQSAQYGPNAQCSAWSTRCWARKEPRNMMSKFSGETWNLMEVLYVM